MLLFLLLLILPIPLLIWFFIRSKTKKTKWIIGVFAILFITFSTTIVLGLWSMGIEDLYGDKQNIFWEGSSGDTIKLVDNRKKKSWQRVSLKKRGIG